MPTAVVPSADAATVPPSAFTSTKVKASLVDAKDLLANSIKVVTHRNVVYVMGRVTAAVCDVLDGRLQVALTS